MGQPSHDIQAKFRLVQFGEEHDSLSVPLSVDQCFSHLENSVGTHDLGLAEIGLDLSGKLQAIDDVQPHGDRTRITQPPFLDDSSQLLGTESS